MAGIIDFPRMNAAVPVDPDKVLQSALGQLEVAVIVGVTSEGDFYFASSEPDGAEVTWWLERAKHKLMQITDDMEEGLA